MLGILLRKLPERYLNAFLEAVLAFGLFVWDPLGWSHHVEQMIDRWVAVGTQYSEEFKPRDQLAVVLIDDEALGYFQHDWPLSYSQVAGLGKRIACAGAAAIFFDFSAAGKYNLADDDQPTTDGNKVGLSPNRVALTQSEEKIVTLVGDTDFMRSKCGSGIPPRRPPIFFANIAGIQSPLLTRLSDHRATLLLPSIPTDYDNLYPGDARIHTDGDPGLSALSPAFGLFQTLCGESATIDGRTFAGCPGNRAGVDPKRPIFLTWSGWPIEDQHLLSETHLCGAIDQSAIGRMKKAGGELISPALERCNPVLTLRGADLYEEAPDFGPHHRDPRSFLEGKIVFVGVALPGLNDSLQSPLQVAPLPGVYVHAVALDNLLRFGSNYYTKPAGNDKLAAAAAFLGITNFLLAALLEKLPTKRPRTEQHPLAERIVRAAAVLWAVAWRFVVLMMWFGVCAWFTYLERWPTSFIAPLLVSGGGSLVIFAAFRNEVRAAIGWVARQDEGKSKVKSKAR